MSWPLCVWEESTGAQVVLVNGRFDAELSQLDALPEGAVVGSLQSLYGKHQAKLDERLAQSRGPEAFTALNTVGFQDAVGGLATEELGGRDSHSDYLSDQSW